MAEQVRDVLGGRVLVERGLVVDDPNKLQSSLVLHWN